MNDKADELIKKLSANQDIKKSFLKGFGQMATELNEAGYLKAYGHQLDDGLADTVLVHLKQTVGWIPGFKLPEKDQVLASYKLQRFLEDYAMMDVKKRKEYFGDNHTEFTKLINESFANATFKGKVDTAKSNRPTFIAEQVQQKELFDEYQNMMDKLVADGLPLTVSQTVEQKSQPKTNIVPERFAGLVKGVLKKLKPQPKSVAPPPPVPPPYKHIQFDRTSAKKRKKRKSNKAKEQLKKLRKRTEAQKQELKQPVQQTSGFSFTRRLR